MGLPCLYGLIPYQLGMAPERMEANDLSRKGKLRPRERQAFTQGHTAGVGGHPVGPVLPE